MITSAYGSSLSFGSIERSKYIGHNIYTGRISNFHSKPTPIHGPVQKSYLNYSYSRSHFIWLPQAVSKKPIYRLSQKASYDFKIIDPVINGFSPHEARSHFHIYDNSIITFFIKRYMFRVFKHFSC